MTRRACSISSPNKKLPNPTKIVVIGGGFGGINCARALAKSPASVTVVDRSNHHLFQPLLYQVATASLSPADIAYPIRSVLGRQDNATVLMDEVTAVDIAHRVVILKNGKVPYDLLVVATGATHSYFGNPDWETFAPGLKSISDATKIRQRILIAFESAEAEHDSEARKAMMQFVLVGGGPTGVEMAGAIAELAHRALTTDFRNIDPRQARVTLMEAGPRVLASFPPELSEKAKHSLEKLGVEVLTGSKVEKISAEGVTYNGKFLASRTVIWTAGVAASPAGKWLGAEMDRAGRVVVGSDLSLPGHPEIFVIGDTAATKDAEGKPLPGVAPVAMQQGRYVGKLIHDRLMGQTSHAPFEYRDKGNLATIGRRAAVADFGKFRLSGLMAWLTWLTVHIYFLIGFRNRLLVLIQWAWAYVTFQRGARLIVPRFLWLISFLR